MVSPLQEKASCCVIGASFHGLAAADALKAVGYADLTILEQNNAVGGPWSLGGYASLQTNTPAESFHYPSFPPGPAFVNQHGRVNGSEVQAYLNHYVDERNLRQHIQFNTFVEDVQETTDGRWKVATSRGEHIFDKLVVASGIFSKPALPDWAIPLRVRLPGQQSSPNSTGWAVHTSALEHASLRTAILKDCQPESHIVVVGSSKSALDTATWLARDTSSKVTLLSRTAPVPNPGPLSGRLGLQWGMMSRLAASFAPYYPAFGYVPSLWRRFIHHTVLGRFLRRWFWNDMLSSCLSFNQYHRSHNAQKLAPVKKQNYAWMHSTKIFPVTPDFYEHVHSGRINVIVG